MENQSLTDIIQETMANVEPASEPVNQVEPEDTDDSEITIDDLLKKVEDEEEAEETDEVSEEDDEEGEEDPHLAETYQVKVDGEIVEVSLKEALAGYQRQADYTRKSQALANEREELNASTQEFSETLATLEQLDSAWEENPVQVLAHFTSNTDNPTQSIALLIKELASSGALDREFLDMFGITDEVREAWSKESEVDGLRRKVSQVEKSEANKAEEVAYEAEVQKAIAEYDSQIDDILKSEGLDLTAKQRDAFRTKVAEYAFENEITNLKAAYKALKYEESEKKKVLATKTVERVKQKKAASVVGRSGSGSSGAQPITDSSDLQAVIRAAMDEQSSTL
jgi:hypothetical protein